MVMTLPLNEAAVTCQRGSLHKRVWPSRDASAGTVESEVARPRHQCPPHKASATVALACGVLAICQRWTEPPADPSMDRDRHAQWRPARRPPDTAPTQPYPRVEHDRSCQAAFPGECTRKPGRAPKLTKQSFVLLCFAQRRGIRSLERISHRACPKKCTIRKSPHKLKGYPGGTARSRQNNTLVLKWGSLFV